LKKQIGGPAIGLFQWEPKWYSAANPRTQTGVLARVGYSIESQIDFMFYQQSPDYKGSLKPVKKWIEGTKSFTSNVDYNLSSATKTFCRDIEKAGKPNMEERISRALFYYNQFNDPKSKLYWS